MNRPIQKTRFHLLVSKNSCDALKLSKKLTFIYNIELRITFDT